jgi:hypothetical protein
MALGIKSVIEKPERRPMLAAVQRICVSAISLAMNAQRIGMSRIRVTQFTFLQIREQVKGRSKERGLTIVFQCRAQCPIEPAKELARLSQVISQLAHQSANGGGHKSGTDTIAHHVADEDPCAGIREF